MEKAKALASRRERKVHDKCTALAWSTGKLDPSPMGLGDRLGDAEPKARTSGIQRLGFGRPIKPLEDLRLLVRREADPRIRDLELGPTPDLVQGERDAAAGGCILDRVLHEVQQESPQMCVVCLDGGWFHGSELQRDAAGLGQGPSLPDNLGKQRRQLNASPVQAKHAGIGAGE